MDNLVSVIVPVYNSKQFLIDTIESVINQTFSNWELLLVDDCSSDGSYELCKQYAEKDCRIRVFKTERPSGSPTLPRNTGIKNAKGRYLSFLDSDDEWLPEKLEKQLQILARFNTPLSFCGYVRMDETGKEFYKPGIPPVEITYQKLLRFNHIGCSTAIYDTNFFGKKYFPEERLALFREDYVFWLHLLKMVKSIYGTQELLVRYRVRKKSFSSDKLRMLRLNWIIYTKVEKLGLVSSFFNLFLYGIKWLFHR